MPNPVLSAGSRAPAFTLASSEGGRLRLTGLRGQWVVLLFYARDGARTCTQELCDFQELLPSFEERGAAVIGLCSDPVEEHKDFARELGLGFPLLCDRDSRVAARYGAWREKRSNGRRWLGLVRSTFLLDPGGRVVRVFDNVRVRGHAQRVLAALDAALARA